MRFWLTSMQMNLQSPQLKIQDESADADKPHLAAEMKVYPYCEKWALSWTWRKHLIMKARVKVLDRSTITFPSSRSSSRWQLTSSHYKRSWPFYLGKKERKGKERKGKERKGKARQGKERKGKERKEARKEEMERRKRWKELSSAINLNSCFMQATRSRRMHTTNGSGQLL